MGDLCYQFGLFRANCYGFGVGLWLEVQLLGAVGRDYI